MQAAIGLVKLKIVNALSIKETVDGVYVYPILEFEKGFCIWLNKKKVGKGLNDEYPVILENIICTVSLDSLLAERYPLF